MSVVDSLGAKKDKAERLLSEISAISAKVNATHSSIKSKENQIDSLVSQLSDIYEEYHEKQVDEHGNHIMGSSLVELFVKYKSELERLKVTSARIDETFKKVREDERQTKELLKQAQERLSISVDAISSDKFGKSADAFKSDMKSYQLKLFVSVVVLIVAATGITFSLKYYTDLIFDSEFLTIILRYFVLSPLLFLVIFYGRQFNISRLNYEKYNYKSVLAFSLQSHIKTMRNEFEENEIERLDFVIDKLQRLYTEPFYDTKMGNEYRLEMERIKRQVKSDNSERVPTHPKTQNTPEVEEDDVD